MRIFFILLLVIPTIGWAEIYKCIHDGKTSYSESPCKNGNKSTLPIETSELKFKFHRPEKYSYPEKYNTQPAVLIAMLRSSVIVTHLDGIQCKHAEKLSRTARKQVKSACETFVAKTQKNGEIDQIEEISSKIKSKISPGSNAIDDLHKLSNEISETKQLAYDLRNVVYLFD